jgi:hypothetical protein
VASTAVNFEKEDEDTMSDNPVTKADGLKYAEIRAATLGTLEGGRPDIRPIRKRGYHRALKRGELWAVNQKAMLDMVNALTKQMYRDNIERWYENAAFYGLLPKE